ncbi:MAG: SGNH/GDSL hydrolase family protein [Planctomycetes bacterium]|nr:SGNH/GDSL hydrolase family protein [Planctomycetota bacterium]
MAYNVDDAHLLEPFWVSDVMHGESLLFIRGDAGAQPSARLLFPPKEIICVRNAAGTVTYAEGRDYLVEPGSRQFALPTESRIPFIEAAQRYRRAGESPGIAHKVGDPDTLMFFSEGHYFHDLQTAVTYRHEGRWQGCKPDFQGDRLPRTMSKTRNGEPLTLCISGDSISAGCNASKSTGVPPFMPPWTELVPAVLEKVYGSTIRLRNYALGGAGVTHGVPAAEPAAKDQPDLFVIAYGMNNVRERNPGLFRHWTQTIIETVRKGTPEAEFVLVASMLGNPDWTHTPAEMFPLYRDELQSLCGEGIILADLTAVWTELLNVKDFLDITGNGVNHPNDFGHRVYAQVLLSLLMPPG